MRAYKREFNSQIVPRRKTLLRWLAQFRTPWDLQNQDRAARDGTPRSGRPTIRTEEVIATVSDSVEMSTNCSLHTINTERYLEVLEKFWDALPASERRQDGATFHCSIASRAWINEHFTIHVNSRRLDTFWSPHSPDLSPQDFYLWGYLKGKVSANKPRKISQIKKNLRMKLEPFQQV